ncbi:MAG TPA: aspartate aminotransferase family protein [Cytophagales bacterium]|nr:aspartate aminotransferase family protein [Cytophagales bacterium]
MKLFDVYPLYDIEPIRAQGEFLWDSKGERYIDLYGGHAVISIGHSHPHYVHKISEQLAKIGFYSNSVHISLQNELAEKLGALSAYESYKLFLINSGAEAVENALKLASFKTGKKNVLAFSKAFHGRTSAAVEATENLAIQAPINKNGHVVFHPLNNLEGLEDHFLKGELSSVIIEGIQGVGGVNVPSTEFMKTLRGLCNKHKVVLILDEIQSGYGRTGMFFAHQHMNIKADIITVAKGMGNGFPVGGILISPDFEASYGLLGTTFGGNHLACAAAVAVLDVIKEEDLIANASRLGETFINELKSLPAIVEVRGKGLMIGIEFDYAVEALRKNLLFKHKVFTGNASNKNTIRLLPTLNIQPSSLEYFLEALKKEMQVLA